ncbi:MAG: hypothetical protein HY776_06585 [Actinobacteria bacterium]|nr:hypothetical protein [Actinomycetota bacterium]
MSNSQERKWLSPPWIGAVIGFPITVALVSYGYRYAAATDPRVTSFFVYWLQKPYRLTITLPASLFPIILGYLLGREKQEKQQLRATAEENRYLYQQTLEKQKALDQLMYRISQAHEEERKRISRELHDGIAQNISGMILNLSYVKTFLRSKLPRLNWRKQKAYSKKLSLT